MRRLPLDFPPFHRSFRFVTPLMRKIGTVESRVAAQRFCDFLITQGIDSSIDPVDSTAPDSLQALWIKEEAKVPRARELFAEFNAAPNDARYSVNAAASKVRAEQEALNRKRLRAQQGMATPTRRSLAAHRPIVTLILVATCVTLGVLTDFGRPTPRISRDGRLMESPETVTLDLLKFRSQADAKESPDDPFVSIKKGHWWRLLTPALLHGDIGHLAINMFCIFSFGSVLERVIGKRSMVVLILFTAVLGNVVQVLWPESNGGGTLFGGASGIGYGLLGFVWMRPFYDDRFPLAIPPVFLIMGLMFLLLGVANIVHGIANGAHVGGLAAGMALAALSGRANKGKVN